MKNLRYTLIVDGTSDRALLYILNWLLRRLGVGGIDDQWADFSRFPKPPKKLAEKVIRAIDLFPCDILFIHRDAEREPIDKRVSEIRDAENLVKSLINLPIVCVIPVRMTEAWLLFDELAIRRAVGNPNGKQRLNLPKITEIESIPNPKIKLEEIFSTASGRTKRRQENHIPIDRLAELIDDFEPLLDLTAFQKLEEELRHTLIFNKWI
jgi:hypothetical protein